MSLPHHNHSSASSSSGRSPFPIPSVAATTAPARPSRPSSRPAGHHLTLRQSLESVATEDSAVSSMGAHQSPFAGLLRFSPSNNGSSHQHSWALSPHNTLRPRTRFFESHTKASNTGSAVNANRAVNVDSSNDGGNSFSASLNDTNSSNRESISSTATQKAAVDGIPVDHLRSLAMQTVLGAPSQAVFYASLLYSKTSQPDDALLLAQAHLHQNNYTACLRILEESTVMQSEYPWEGLLVAAAALSAQEEWTSLTEVLEDACRLPDRKYSSTTNSLRLSSLSQMLADDDDIGWNALKASVYDSGSSSSIHPLASLCWWRGLAYLNTGSGIRAVVYWKRALKIDAKCQQAWEGLLQRHLLTSAEAYRLVQSLHFAEDMQWLRSLYLARIEMTPQEKSHSPPTKPDESLHHPSLFSLHGAHLDTSAIPFSSPMPTMKTPGMKGLDLSKMHDHDEDRKGGSQTLDTSSQLAEVDAAFDKLWVDHKLQQAPQVLAMAARRAYRRYEWKSALDYCEQLSQVDPTMPEAAYCYVATLVILGRKRVLFRLAHDWVEARPKAAHSWFAVGAYYYSCQRFHIAQRHFCRATRLDPQCTEAWIAFGCSFAACDESDQALASFRAAQRLSSGEHTSLLYMGMEYVRTNHLVLANYFLQSALTASGGDPLCLHELGVLAAHKGEHKEAIEWFERALASAGGGSTAEEHIEMCHDPYWEPTLFNLGHSYRKTRRFESAKRCFSQCVALCPDKFSTYVALGFTQHLTEDLGSAIEYYHQALSIKADDPFCTEMLNRALEEELSSSQPGVEVPLIDHQKAARLSVLRTPGEASMRRDESRMSESMDVDMDMSDG